MRKKNRLYNMQILQTDIWETISVKKKKRRKTNMLFENNQAHVCLVKRKNIDKIS